MEKSIGDWIFDRRQAGKTLADIPANLKPTSESSGYRIQNYVFERMQQARRANAVGWKIGATTPQMRALLGIENAIAGQMLSTARHESGTSISSRAYCRLGIEAEIAMVLKDTLAGGATRVDADKAAAAVGSIHAAIELVDDRYGGDFKAFGVPTIVADAAFHAGFVLGPPVRDWQKLDLAAVHGITRVNGEIQGEGVGADVMGHPMAALAWLANKLMTLQRKPLEPGDVVLTGSLPLVYWVKADDAIEVELEPLGKLRLKIA